MSSDEVELRFPKGGSSTLPEEFRESVSHSISIFGDEADCLFRYHAQQNYGVDSSQLPAGLEKFDDMLRNLLGSAYLVIVKECSKRLQEVLGVTIEPLPNSLMQLYRILAQGRRQERLIAA
jgi:hypothetical protein